MDQESSTTVTDLFPSGFTGTNNVIDYEDIEGKKLRIKRKMYGEYNAVTELPAHLEAKLQGAAQKKKVVRQKKVKTSTSLEGDKTTSNLLLEEPKSSTALAKRDHSGTKPQPPLSQSQSLVGISSDNRINQSYAPEKPQWHAPWKLMRVISGHLGWVRSVCVEPDNQWFATGSADRTIKIWDLASGKLRLTLTGHIMAVRALAVSARHPYLFSAGEDKMVKCWDLEQNKVIRHYHGHLNGVYTMDLHPNLDLVATAGRDSVVRVWDMRTRHPVHVLTGHKNAISSVRCQESDPQIISTSMDATVRLYDLAAGKTRTVLTHHKKAVRALTLHPEEFTFATGSPDNIKEWKFPEGSFMHNFGPSQNSIINTLSANSDGVMFAGGDNGSMGFYDWKTGHKFQQLDTAAVPGSLEAEHGIFASAYDKTGLRLITTEADKSIKMWKEDPEATPETHPGIEWNPQLARQHY